MAGCEYGGFILAYLVTGSGGIFYVHLTAVFSRQSQATIRSKLSQEKKEGAAPKRSLESDSRNKMEPHPDTRIVTE
jgi:hypothetical protein